MALADLAHQAAGRVEARKGVAETVVPGAEVSAVGLEPIVVADQRGAVGAGGVGEGGFGGSHDGTIMTGRGGAAK
jgi:hypothetical protein